MKTFLFLMIVSVFFLYSVSRNEKIKNIQEINYSSMKETVCASEAVDNPNIDAAILIQKCIDANPKMIQFLPGRYFFKSVVNIDHKANMTLRNQGLNQGPACLDDSSAACAIFVAHKNYGGPVLISSLDSQNLNFEYIGLDGNSAQRRKNFNNNTWSEKIAYNARIHNCSDCHFTGFSSIRAAQGTGLEFSGDRAIFQNTLFRDNGWGILQSENFKSAEWADGLTIWSANDLQIKNSKFMDNSDINLILGGAKNAIIENNYFGNSKNYAFASVMFDNFNDSRPGDFSGTVFKNNVIECPDQMCGVGLNIGPHIWYPSKPVRGGKFTLNKISAPQGILTNGTVGSEISLNQIQNQGEFLFLNKRTLISIQKCKTNPVGYSEGDQVQFFQNSIPQQPSGLVDCDPHSLAQLQLNLPKVDSDISKIYFEVLGRSVDQVGGVEYSMQVRSGKLNLAKARLNIAQSPESRQKIKSLYQNVFGRVPAEPEITNWTKYLINDGTIQKMYLLFLRSDESLNSKEF